MNIPLAITACRLLTPLDAPGLSTWSAIQAGTRITTRAAIADALLPENPDLDRSIRIALAVATSAIEGLSLDQHTHLFCATSKGPVTTLLAAAQRLRAGLPLTESQAQHIALGVGAMGPLLARHFQLPGTVHTSVAACASGLHALHRAAQALWRNDCTRALVVAADASLHPLFQASFQRLGVLAPADPEGIRRCNPFSDQGEGFFITEAGAALLLEKTDPDSPPPKNTLALLEHSWIGADSTGLIAIDPLTHSLRYGISSFPATDPLAFIHAHATGTSHDHYEFQALRTSLPAATPLFSAKYHLGHSLGAASLVSLALSTLSHHHGTTPIHTPVPPASPSLTLAQGFGGHIALTRLRGTTR